MRNQNEIPLAMQLAENAYRSGQLSDELLRETASGRTPTPTITFRNNATGETLEVPGTPEARALAAQQSGLNRQQRRAQEAGIKRALRKGKR